MAVVRPKRAHTLLAAMWVIAPLALVHDCLAQARYEVVSIHRADPYATSSGFSDGAQGGIRARNVTALQALQFAYAVEDFQLIDVPNWARSQRFDIAFTPAESEGAPQTTSGGASAARWTRQQQRMQAVLRDRFGLVLRQETREMPVYILTAAKNGPKLSPAAHPEKLQTVNLNNISGGRRLIVTNVTMSAVADTLTWTLARAVQDQTGLVGSYDFRLDWGLDPTPPDAGANGPALSDTPALPSIFTALTEQLGLRLTSGKGPVSVFAVDKIVPPDLDR